MSNVNELRILSIRDVDFTVRDDRADGLEEYKNSTDTALAEVRAIAESARTSDEVDAQIDAKISDLNLSLTYEPIGAEDRANSYTDQKFTEADLENLVTKEDLDEFNIASSKVTHGKDFLSNILETYILNIDYETLLAFDTSEIVINATTNKTSVLGQAILGQLVLA